MDVLRKIHECKDCPKVTDERFRAICKTLVELVQEVESTETKTEEELNALRDKYEVIAQVLIQRGTNIVVHLAKDPVVATRIATSTVFDTIGPVGLLANIIAIARAKQKDAPQTHEDTTATGTNALAEALLGLSKKPEQIH